MSKKAASRGFAISYEDEGHGSPVVLIPGFMQSAAEFQEAGYVDRLAPKWRVLSIDPLGHGKSDKPHDPEPYRSPGVASDVIAVMDAAGIESATLWGYSRGAWLAGMTAIEFPDRLTALIIGGGALTGPPPTQMPGWVEPLLRAEWAAYWSIFPIPLSPEVQARFEAANDPKALANERIGRIESAYTFDLERISVPALIYCGEDDEPEDVVPTAEALNTEVHVVAGCDHAGAFYEMDRVMAFAIPFLEAVAS